MRSSRSTRCAGAAPVDVVGLCSGAFLGVQVAAVRDVRQATLFNGLVYVWDEDARASGMTGQIQASLLDGRRWGRLLGGQIDAVALARAIATRGRLRTRDTVRRLRGEPPPTPTALLLRTVCFRGTRVEVVASEGDPSIGYLQRQVPDGERPPIRVLPGVDHTIRPAWAHATVVDLITSASRRS